MNSKVFPNCSHAKCLCSHILAEVVDLIGRHEETRTPDLYRVKVALRGRFIDGKRLISRSSRQNRHNRRYLPQKCRKLFQ